jgi:hypothetical protein
VGILEYRHVADFRSAIRWNDWQLLTPKPPPAPEGQLSVAKRPDGYENSAAVGDPNEPLDLQRHEWRLFMEEPSLAYELRRSAGRPKPPVALLFVNVCNMMDCGQSQAAGPTIRIFATNVGFANR